MRNLKYTLLGERNQSEKTTYCMILELYDVLEKAKLWKYSKGEWLPTEREK